MSCVIQTTISMTTYMTIIDLQKKNGVLLQSKSNRK